MACRSARGGGTQGQTSGEFRLATWKRTTISGESSDKRRRGMVVKVANWCHTGQTRCEIDRACLEVGNPREAA